MAPPVHPTARAEYAFMRLYKHLQEEGASFTGGPVVTAERLGNVATLTGGRVEASYELGREKLLGRLASTSVYAAYEMSLTLVVDVKWPQVKFLSSSPDALGDARITSEVAGVLNNLRLTFLDYTDPSNPVVVPSRGLVIREPVEFRTIPSAAFNHQQLRAKVTWIGQRIDNRKHLRGANIPRHRMFR